MTYKVDNCEIQVDGEVTDIAFCTTAQYAYERYLEKKKQIHDLEYECSLLINKYHSEMNRANIPYLFSENHVNDMFSKDEEHAKYRKAARELFLEKGFSPDFLKNHKVEFVRSEFDGYNHTAVGVVLVIGDYEYTIKFPQPKNIWSDEDKERLVGEVQFRVNRIHKSKADDFIRSMESVQMPTYDWKQCFEAIETIVAKDTPKEGE